MENVIGKSLSFYVITKYVNIEFVDVFVHICGFETIGLHYFNVFGRRQNLHEAYTVVIPLFVKKFMNHKSPVINGDMEYSRDFTYINNVVQMNLLALSTEKPQAINQLIQHHLGPAGGIAQEVSE